MSNHIAVVGSLGPPQLAVIDSIKSANFKVVFCNTDANDLSGFLTSEFDQYIHIPHLIHIPESQLKLRKFLENIDCYAIVCVSYGISKLLHSFSQDSVDFPLVLSCSLDSIAILENKKEMNNLAVSAGLPVLESAYFIGGADTSQFVNLKYPVVARPSHETHSGGCKACYLDNYESLNTFASQPRLEGIEFVVQPFTAGDQFVVHGFYNKADDQYEITGAFKGLYKKDGVSLGLESILLDPAIEPALKKLARSISLVGCFHFDLIEYQGTLYFLEVNGRLGGTTAKVKALGVDEPSLLLQAFDLIQTTPNKKKDRVSVNKLGFIKKRLSSSDGDPAMFSEERGSLLSALLSKDEVFSSCYFRLAVKYYLDSIKNKLAR